MPRQTLELEALQCDQVCFMVQQQDGHSPSAIITKTTLKVCLSGYKVLDIIPGSIQVVWFLCMFLFNLKNQCFSIDSLYI